MSRWSSAALTPPFDANLAPGPRWADRNARASAAIRTRDVHASCALPAPSRGVPMTLWLLAVIPRRAFRAATRSTIIRAPPLVVRTGGPWIGRTAGRAGGRCRRRHSRQRLGRRPEGPAGPPGRPGRLQPHQQVAGRPVAGLGLDAVVRDPVSESQEPLAMLCVPKSGNVDEAPRGLRRRRALLSMSTLQVERAIGVHGRRRTMPSTSPRSRILPAGS